MTFDPELKTPPFDDVLNEIKRLQDLCQRKVDDIVEQQFTYGLKHKE